MIWYKILFFVIFLGKNDGFSTHFQLPLIVGQYPQHLKSFLPKGTRIGVISAFPRPNGLLNSHSRLCRGYSSPSLSLEDVNILLTRKIAEAISKNFSKENYKVIALDSIKPEDNLTGWMINGAWGPESKAVDIKTLPKTIHDHDLDIIVSIVPVTYRKTGFGLKRAALNQIKGFAEYTILLTLRTPKGSRKILSLSKQTFSEKISKQEKSLCCKTDPNADLVILRQWIEEKFIPLLSQQILYILGDSEKNADTLFDHTAKWLHLMPH